MPCLPLHLLAITGIFGATFRMISSHSSRAISWVTTVDEQ